MWEVECEQLVFTWAHRTLEDHGGGFGTVSRSRGWSNVVDLGVDTAALVSVSSAVRSRSDTYVLAACYRLTRGSLLVLKRAAGVDGSDRPGNYLVQAVWDPSGTLGAVDLVRMEAGGWWARSWPLDAEPVAEADPVRVPVPPWPSADTRAAVPPPVLPPARFATLAEAEDCHRRLASVCPPDLLNRCGLEVGTGWAGVDEAALSSPAGLGSALLERLAHAAELGMSADPQWAERGRSIEAWAAAAEDYIVAHSPLDDLDIDQLHERWYLEAGSATRASRREEARAVASAVSDPTGPPGPRTSHGPPSGSWTDPLSEGGHAVLVALAQRLEEAGPTCPWPSRGLSLRAVIDAAMSDGVRPRAAVELLARTGDPEDRQWIVATATAHDARDLLAPEVLAALAGDDPQRMNASVRELVMDLHRFDDAADAPPHRGWAVLLAHDYLAGHRWPSESVLLERLSRDELAAVVDRVLSEGADPAQVWGLLAGPVGRNASERAFAASGELGVVFVLGPAMAELSDEEVVARARGLWPLLTQSLAWHPALTSAPPRPLDVERRQHRLLLALAVCLVLAMLALVVVLVWRR